MHSAMACTMLVQVKSLILIAVVSSIHNCRGCTPVETSRVVQTVHNYDDETIQISGIKLFFGLKLTPARSSSAPRESVLNAEEYKNLFAEKFGRSRETQFDWTHVSLWLFKKQLKTSRKWHCKPFKLCTLHQLVGTCGSVEFRMPLVLVKQSHIRNYTSIIARVGKEVPKSCGNDQFACGDGHQCISKKYECDGDEDCWDGSDENQAMCTLKWYSKPREVCSRGRFQCAMGKCLPDNFVCDEDPDCPDGSDEFLPRCLKTGRRQQPCPVTTSASANINTQVKNKSALQETLNLIAIMSGDVSDEDRFFCNEKSRSRFPYELEADDFWMKGAWMSPDMAFEPIMQVGGLDLGNITTYVCRFISALGGIIPGRLIYEPNYEQYTCRYTYGRFEEVVSRSESYQFLVTSQKPAATYKWKQFEKKTSLGKIISVLGMDYELYYICRFAFGFNQSPRHRKNENIIANGFFKPTIERCLSPFDARTKLSSDFYLLTEL